MARTNRREKTSQEIFADWLEAKYLLVQHEVDYQCGLRLFVPPGAVPPPDMDDSMEVLPRDAARNAEAAAAHKALANRNSPKASKPARRVRRARRALQVFSPDDIEKKHSEKKTLPTADRQRIEACLKMAEKNDGYRTVPGFHGVQKLLTQMDLAFRNFQEVLDYYSQEFTLSGATEAQHFRVSPVLLDGPPGVGKTAFAQRLAKNLGLSYRKISAGGMQHASLLTGTSRHWSNAHPGEVFNMIAGGASACGVFLVDEADKLSNRSEYAILPALLDLLEPESARNYTDESVGLRFDASRLIVIMTSNSVEAMDQALLSRCEVFDIGKPGVDQRTLIAMCEFDAIRRAIRGGSKYILDFPSIERLAEADIDVRRLIKSVRQAFSMTIGRGETQVRPQVPRQGERKQQFGFLREAS